MLLKCLYQAGEVKGRISVYQYGHFLRFFFRFFKTVSIMSNFVFFPFLKLYSLFYSVPEFMILQRLLPSVTSSIFSHFSIVNYFLDVEKRAHDAVYHQDYNGGTDICGILMIYYYLISGYIFPRHQKCHSSDSLHNIYIHIFKSSGRHFVIFKTVCENVVIL